MRPANRKQPSDRVIKAAQTALATRKYVSLLDVLVGIGLIPGGQTLEAGADRLSRGGRTDQSAAHF